MNGRGRLAVVVDDTRFRTEPHDGGFTPASPVTDPVLFVSDDLGQTWSRAQRVPGGGAPYLNRFLSTVTGLPAEVRGQLAAAAGSSRHGQGVRPAGQLRLDRSSRARVNKQQLRWTSPLRVNGPRTQVSAAPRSQGESFLGDHQGLAASEHAVHVARPEAVFGPNKGSTSTL